ncbi:MAG TPA: hypothetical protein VNN79_12475 [Actinomycetota bacterium]|nr:hypothetical protein [Actinomycetota bacterium]
MSEHDTDLDFDFFNDDEPAPPRQPSEESTPGREQPPEQRRGSRRPPTGRPPVGMTPLLRLAGLIAFAILIVVLLVFWISSCSSASKKNSYKSYYEKVGVVAKDSEQVGRELNDALTTQGIKFGQLESKLNGLAQREQQNVVALRSIRPPGPLRLQHQDALEALEFRVSGLRGLSNGFVQASRSPKNVTTNALRLLQPPAARLVASDVVWDDLFQAPAQGNGGVLQRQGITGVAVPGSIFVVSADYASSRYWEAILQRLQGAATTGSSSGGLHGTGINKTVALPGNQELSQTTENTVTATTDLGFAVTVEDTGDSQEVQVKVTLTIQQSPSPIVQTKTIDLINPGELKQVVFQNLGQVQFATRTTVKVDVQPVPQEKNTSNNSASYPVIFSLG